MFCGRRMERQLARSSAEQTARPTGEAGRGSSRIARPLPVNRHQGCENNNPFLRFGYECARSLQPCLLWCRLNYMDDEAVALYGCSCCGVEVALATLLRLR